MTVPSTPTPATLDAAVYVLAAELWHDSNPGMPIDADCRAWQECVGMARRAVAAAAPILAATHADQLAHAHAAGTAEGAKGERERIAAWVEAECVDLDDDGEICEGCEDTAACIRRGDVTSRLTGSDQDADAIARAGTSEVDRA